MQAVLPAPGKLGGTAQITWRTASSKPSAHTRGGPHCPPSSGGEPRTERSEASKSKGYDSAISSSALKGAIYVKQDSFGK